MKIIKFIVLLLASIMLASCAEYKLNINNVSYLSIRPNETKDLPETYNIKLICDVDEYGHICVSVFNNTDKIMTIDKTKSFFTDKNGNSYAYYDPTIKANTKSYTQGTSSSTTVNIGAITTAAGIGGSVATALNGVNVEDGYSSSTTTTNTSYHIDQPQISIAPHSKQIIGYSYEHTFCVSEYNHEMYINTDSPQNTVSSINITISYSIDEGSSYEIIQLPIYCNALLVSPIKKAGHINDALRIILSRKTDSMNEQWYSICVSGQEILVDSRDAFADTYRNQYQKIYKKHTSFVNYK